jgi:hypothetical protein
MNYCLICKKDIMHEVGFVIGTEMMAEECLSCDTVTYFEKGVPNGEHKQLQ